MSELKLFTVEMLEERLNRKLGLPVQELHPEIQRVLRPLMEVLSEEINEIRKELRRKI